MTKWPVQKLTQGTITQIRHIIVWYICNLEMDMFGLRTMDKLGVRVMPFRIRNPRQKRSLIKIQKKVIIKFSNGISSSIKMEELQYNHMGPDKAIGRINMHKIIQLIHSMQVTGSDVERAAATLYIPYLYGYLATIKASLCIASNKPVTQDIHQLCSLSLDCDLMSGKLKYASMLYCCGQYAQAAHMVAHCEGLLGPDVAHYCGCVGRQYAHQSDRYLEKKS